MSAERAGRPAASAPSCGGMVGRSLPVARSPARIVPAGTGELGVLDLGVLAGMVSSGLGGSAIVATRYLAGVVDPATLGALRFGIGFLLLLPLGLLRRDWPPLRDWAGAVLVSLLFFGIFPLLFNAALARTTAAHGALALSALPALALFTGVALKLERLTRAKAWGAALTTLGVIVALGARLEGGPPDAWLGDLLMLAGTACLVVYNIWSKPFLARCGPIPFAVIGMGTGTLALGTVGALGGGLAVLPSLDQGQWLAIGWLGVFGAGFAVFLWSFALSRTTPALVGISITMNPVTAISLGALVLGEPFGWNLIAGLVLVIGGIVLASRRPATTPLSRAASCAPRG